MTMKKRALVAKTKVVKIPTLKRVKRALKDLDLINHRLKSKIEVQ